MTEHADFAALYGELGIGADLTPGQFRQAYRRRVAQLHPDQGGSEADTARLQELNRQYAAALAFLRTHGRLPGAPVAPRAAAAPVRADPDAASDAHAQAGIGDAPHAGHDAADLHGKAGPNRVSRWITWMAAVAVLVLVVHACAEPAPDNAPSVASTFDTAVEDALGIDRIRLGMDKAQVEAIQGRPVGLHDARWDYGPSWIAFKCGGAVSDWYSSPLRPLAVDTPHPTTDEWERYDAAPPPGCRSGA